LPWPSLKKRFLTKFGLPFATLQLTRLSLENVATRKKGGESKFAGGTMVDVKKKGQKGPLANPT